MKAQTHYNTCKTLMNRNVLIKTKHGNYRGKIVKVSKHKVYLKLSSYPSGKKARVSFFFFAPIIPLVLYNLLVIVLLDRPRRPFYY